MDTAKKPEIKLSKSGRIRFTAGFFVCAILWMTGLAIVSAVLLPQHLRDIAGEAASTTIFGYVNAATAIASLVANLLFGNCLTGRVLALAAGRPGSFGVPS